MIAINPMTVISREEMKTRMASFYQTIKDAPMWDSNKEMMLPGELEYLTMLARQKNGIPLPANLYEELISLGKSLSVEATF